MERAKETAGSHIEKHRVTAAENQSDNLNHIIMLNKYRHAIDSPSAIMFGCSHTGYQKEGSVVRLALSSQRRTITFFVICYSKACSSQVLFLFADTKTWTKLEFTVLFNRDVFKLKPLLSFFVLLHTHFHAFYRRGMLEWVHWVTAALDLLIKVLYLIFMTKQQIL